MTFSICRPETQKQSNYLSIKLLVNVSSQKQFFLESMRMDFVAIFGWSNFVPFCHLVYSREFSQDASIKNVNKCLCSNRRIDPLRLPRKYKRQNLTFRHIGFHTNHSKFAASAHIGGLWMYVRVRKSFYHTIFSGIHYFLPLCRVRITKLVKFCVVCLNIIKCTQVDVRIL